MVFNRKNLSVYQRLIQTTELQKGYQEFIRLFRYVRIELEKTLSEWNFSGNIVENAMDYSYFHCTNDFLKGRGLKIVVVFVHKEFCFEVWISGYNRKIQCEYFERLKNIPLPYILNNDPSRIDFILNSKLEVVDLADGDDVVERINTSVHKLVDVITAL